MKISAPVTITFGILVLLVGCSTPSKSFINKHGQESHITVCDGPSWYECFKEAGKICQSNGYEITDKSTSKVYGFFSNTDHKEIIFVCKNNVSKETILKDKQPALNEQKSNDNESLDKPNKQINTEEKSDFPQEKELN